MNGHVLYPALSERPECLLIHWQLLQLVQRFQTIDNPTSQQERGNKGKRKWTSEDILKVSPLGLNQNKSIGNLRIITAVHCISFILSKHCVLHVQMRLFGICEEKLGTIGVGAIICHRHHSSDIVLKRKRNQVILLHSYV